VTSDQTITYEAFGESAQALHDVCQCTLTQLKDRVSAGFPCHSVLGYARLLNQKGHVLAIVPPGFLRPVSVEYDAGRVTRGEGDRRVPAERNYY